MKMRKIAILILTFFIMTTAASAEVVTTTQLGEAIDANDTELINEYLRTEEPVTQSPAYVSLKINPGSEVLPVNMNVLGTQHEIGGEHGYYLDENTGDLTDGYVRMAENLYKTPIARWGGTSTNYYNLIRYILDPEYKYESSGKIEGENVPGIGPVEFIKSVQALNPDAEFIFCVGIDVMTPQNTVDFISFLTDSATTKWGALRASYGLTEPIKLYGLELGNENYSAAGMDDLSTVKANAKAEAEANGITDDAAIEQYINDYIASYKANAQIEADKYCDTALTHIAAVRKAHSNIRLFPNVNYRSNRASADTWNSTVARRLASQTDAVAFHYYYPSRYSIVSGMKYLDHVQKLFYNEIGEYTKFVITEHAQWGSGNVPTRIGLSSCLADVSFFNAMMKRDDVLCTNYHNISTESLSQWSLFKPMGGKYYKMGTAEIFKMYSQNIGDTVVETTVTSDTESICGEMRSNQQLSVLATTKDDLLYLSLSNNYADRNIKVDLDFGGDYTLIKKSEFTAPNMLSCVYNPSLADVFRKTVTKENTNKFSSYTVPAKTAAFLTLRKNGSSQTVEYETYGEPEIPDVTADKTGSYSISDSFSSLANWGGNISLVGGKLKVSGISIPKFDFAQLGNSYKIKTDIIGNGGIRLGVCNSNQNYYQLGFDGEKIIVSKVLASDVKYENSGDVLTGVSGGTLEIIFNKNKISWNFKSGDTLLDFGTEEFENTVGLDAETTKIILYGDGAQFDNFSAVSYLEFITDGGKNGIFRELAGADETRITEEDGAKVYEFSKPQSVRIIKNNSSANAEILVSNNGYTYFKLFDVTAGEEKLNLITGKKYRFVKTNADIEIYTDLNYSDVLCDDEPFDIFTRLNGRWISGAKFTSSDRNVIFAENAKAVPLRGGKACISATDGTNSCDAYMICRQFTNVSESGFETTDVVKIPETTLGKSHVMDGWSILRGSVSTVNNNLTAKVENNRIKMTGTGVDYNSGSISNLVYLGDYSGLGDSYTVKLRYYKSNVGVGAVFKFMMHNYGQNFYALTLGGAREATLWEFAKVENGTITDAVYGEKFTSITAGGGKGASHNYNDIEITVDNNTISWTIDGTRYNKVSFDASGTFTDSKPFAIEPSECKMAFTVTGNYTWNTQLESFEVSSYQPGSIIEKDGAVFIDTEAENLENGVIYAVSYKDGALDCVSVTDDFGDDGFAKIKASPDADKTKLFFFEKESIKPLRNTLELN